MKALHLLQGRRPVWFPFIGSSGILQKMTKKHGSEWRACLELSKQYSTNVLGMRLSTELLVVVFGEKNVRQVFNEKEFDNRPDNFFARLRITFANGEVWKEHRQFAVKNLKYVGYGKTQMEKEIQNALSSLLEQIKESNDKPINIANLLSESVINVLWKFVAGERIKEETLKHLLDLFRQRGKAFSVAGGLLNQIPWCRFIIPELSGYSLIQKLNADISKVIEEAIEKHKNKEVEGNDFIYKFLDVMYSKEQLKIVCLDFFIAGSQTSSNYLSFAFLKVLKCQDIQEKIFNEIDTIIGDRTPCWNDNERLVYTSAFMQEVHRYYPVVCMAGPRSLQTDTSIDGYRIPKGRRRCPGDSLAKSFIFITFVGILQKYRIHVSNGTVPSDKPVIGILSSPKPYTAEFTLRK
ncbi:hypothetical protein HW555_010617 [Spodoptera exigua]|uniref:Cytochrome p450 n=1 Tax=Spodoptera exigua TaxID=7107 RepID=A0A835KZM8_SPOEX|nr:hypothetical protein HW555_010617 [Spodoptera exigua]